MRKYITVGISITLMILSISFCIVVARLDECEEKINKLEKELVEKKQEVEILKDRTRLLEEDVKACDWYIRFYDEFHEVVGAFE